MKRFFLLASLTAILLCGTETLARDWTQFRGPGGLGVSDERDLPTRWSETENLAWRTELPGYGASSPITLGDRVFVTCYSGYGTGGASQQMENLTLHVVCIDRADGRITWDQKLKPR